MEDNPDNEEEWVSVTLKLNSFLKHRIHIISQKTLERKVWKKLVKVSSFFVTHLCDTLFNNNLLPLRHVSMQDYRIDINLTHISTPKTINKDLFLGKVILDILVQSWDKGNSLVFK